MRIGASGRWLLTYLLLPLGPVAGSSAADRVATQAELSEELVVKTVLTRNPTLAQMAAAWEAANARYPQVTALDDPMFNGMLAPSSIGSPDVEFGYRVELSQKIPFLGKRQLRGQAALAEASAAGSEGCAD